MSRFDNNCLWITGGVNHGVVVTVFVRILRDNGEAAYLSVAHPIDGGCTYDAA